MKENRGFAIKDDKFIIDLPDPGSFKQRYDRKKYIFGFFGLIIIVLLIMKLNNGAEVSILYAISIAAAFGFHLSTLESSEEYFIYQAELDRSQNSYFIEYISRDGKCRMDGKLSDLYITREKRKENNGYNVIVFKQIDVVGGGIRQYSVGKWNSSRMGEIRRFLYEDSIKPPRSFGDYDDEWGWEKGNRKKEEKPWDTLK
jgi:hypothetical protein